MSSSKTGRPAFRRLPVLPLCVLGMSASGAVWAADAPQSTTERLDALEQRLSELESSAVLSEPETRVKKVEVWVDSNGNEHDEAVPGSRKTVTYQRERVFRRQTISEKIEEALADQQ